MRAPRERYSHFGQSRLTWSGRDGGGVAVGTNGYVRRKEWTWCLHLAEENRTWTWCLDLPEQNRTWTWCLDLAEENRTWT
eukprot:3306314-Pleurochrysis_carterae.AAC.1